MKTFDLDISKPGELSDEARVRLDDMQDGDIDYSDIPDLGDDDALWAKAVPLKARKQVVTIRLDADLVSFFKAQGQGYQSRINAVLRTYVDHVSTQAQRR